MNFLPSIVCFQQRLTHYREEFFQRIKVRLSNQGTEFSLVHGHPDAGALKKRDSGFLEWAHLVNEITIKFGSFVGVWVTIPKNIRKPAIVIITQENKLLANYWWLLLRRFGGPKVIFWGHGRNLQTTSPNGLRERIKKFLVGQVDWWFAYTQMTRSILLNDGYPDDRISVLDNAIDNESFKADLASVKDTDLATIYSQLQVLPCDQVGLFCGSLWPEKRIDFMVKAADLIHAAMPSFRFVVVGDGPSVREIQDAAKTRPWMHWVGVKKGREKAAYFKLAKVVINPGAVGLHVLDSFLAGVPMATTADAKHGPEVVYLEHGINGLNVQGGVNEYASSVIQLLSDTAYLNRVRSAAYVSAERYSLENMVNQFVTGIEKCLAMPKKL